MANPTKDLLPDKHGIPRYKFRIQRIGIEIEGAWKPKAPAAPPAAPPPFVFTPEQLLVIRRACAIARQNGDRRFIAFGFTFSALQVMDEPNNPRPEVPPVPAPPLFTDGTKVKGDPSVKFPNAVGLAAVGEVVSEPMIRPALWNWIRDHYPDVTNRTCGIHVHMSLRHELDYQRLINRTFHDHMLVGLHRWGLAQKLAKDHVFWPRIRGCNLFCQDVHHGDLQAQFKGGHDAFHDNRYGMVNYCWQVHKTLEVRVLPTFADKKMAIRAVRRVLNLTEEYLAQARQIPEETHRLVVAVPDVNPVLPIRVAPTVAEPRIRFHADYTSFIAYAHDIGWMLGDRSLAFQVFPGAGPTTPMQPVKVVPPNYDTKFYKYIGWNETTAAAAPERLIRPKAARRQTVDIRPLADFDE